MWEERQAREGRGKDENRLDGAVVVFIHETYCCTFVTRIYVRNPTQPKASHSLRTSHVSLISSIIINT